jgi:hypothetical protein
MAQHRNELLAKLGGLALVQKARFAGGQPLTGTQVKTDQLGKQLEHADRLGVVQPCRARINGAEGAPEGAVGEDNRHRDVALEAVHRRGVMAAIRLILGDMVNDDLFPRLPDLMTDRSLELQFAPGPEAELDVIAHRASDPATLGHPGYGRKAHSGGAADNFQDGRHGSDAVDSGEVCLKVGRQV